MPFFGCKDTKKMNLMLLIVVKASVISHFFVTFAPYLEYYILLKMDKRRKKSRNRQGLQVVTLCISTAMVLVLLGLVVFSVFSARNLSMYFKENLTITLLLGEDATDAEAKLLCKKLLQKPYLKSIDFVSKEQALKEQTAAMGSDPSDFIGENPFVSSIEMHLHADYANGDSLRWINKELHKYPKISDITYPKDLMDSVNQNIQKISVVLLVLAVLLTFISFSLISNTVKLSVFSRRFSIHTMKLVGASWGFIRRPFIRRAIAIGLLAALLACLVLGGGIYALFYYQPEAMVIVTWEVLAITAGTICIFGIIITTFCTYISVSKFLRMKAGDLYKI